MLHQTLFSLVLGAEPAPAHSGSTPARPGTVPETSGKAGDIRPKHLGRDADDPANAPADRLLTEREAAARLAISPRKLWDIRNRGLIPHVRIGQCVRYDPDDLAAWIEARKSGSARNHRP
ncbi:MAG: helix-turn-helix domain-containing protein [Planctomycetota bacterium]